MITPRWQLQTPVTAIVFDCDGTLSAIEGVNELARDNGVYDVVEALTTEAMDKTGLNAELYQKRLALIRPTQPQVEALAQTYFLHCVPDAPQVIRVLQRLNKSIYIVSAGVNPAIRLFAERLQVARQQIYAVDLQFDESGHYLDFDHTSPLIHNQGKYHLVSELKKQHPRIAHIGDALNDFVTKEIVTRFIGYGGVYYRDHLAACCEYYIRSLSLSPVLTLCLTQQEYQQLTPAEAALYHTGLDAMASRYL